MPAHRSGFQAGMNRYAMGLTRFVIAVKTSNISLSLCSNRRDQVTTTTVIARSEATHPRVVSLAPLGQFTSWQSPAGMFVRRKILE